jgi:diamine N-acetyltransferase
MQNVGLAEVGAGNWRQVAGLRVFGEQERFVSPVTFYLSLCAYEGGWRPLAVTRDGQMVGFVMWAADGGLGRIGGLVVDAAHQRTGVGHAVVRQLRDRLVADEGCAAVAVSYAADNVGARHLARTLDFHETGETDGTELVARWHP